MARSRKGSKGAGYEFWTRRPIKGRVSGHGRDAKRCTHRLERRAVPRIINRQLRDVPSNGPEITEFPDGTITRFDVRR